MHSQSDEETGALVGEFAKVLGQVQLMLKSGSVVDVPFEALEGSYSQDWAGRQAAAIDKAVKKLEGQISLEAADAEALQAQIAEAHERMLALRREAELDDRRCAEVEGEKKARLEELMAIHTVELPEAEATIQRLLEQVQADVPAAQRQRHA